MNKINLYSSIKALKRGFKKIEKKVCLYLFTINAYSLG